jgi:hypothetical protein
MRSIVRAVDEIVGERIYANEKMKYRYKGLQDPTPIDEDREREGGLWTI